VQAQPNAKLMPPDKAVEVYRAHKDFYDGLQRAIMKATKSAPLTRMLRWRTLP
jgi:hypothetical protein